MLQIALLVIPFVFAFLVVFGALSDLSTFTIPNWVSYGLVGLFVIYAFFVWLDTPYLPSLSARIPPVAINFAVGFVVLIVAIIFWTRGYIGGGDAKYLAATALWMGPIGAVNFMVLLSALALLMAFLLKLSARWGFLVEAGNLPGFIKRLYAKIDENKLPYGFPIGLAALVMIPDIFSR